MALQPFFSRDIYDVIVVPVGVAYDKLLEEVLFAYELLGVPKPRESTMVFLTISICLNCNSKCNSISIVAFHSSTGHTEGQPW